LVVYKTCGLFVYLLEQLEQLLFGKLTADLQQLVLVEKCEVQNLREEQRLGLRALVCRGLA
jgi:hypothetical protein